MSTAVQEVQGRDAAFPQNLYGYGGVIIGYIGGPRAYNVWRASQWANFTHNDKIPVWVGGLAGKTEAMQCVGILQSLGVPMGCVVMLDMEARIDKTYVEAFYDVLHAAGYKVWVYGSTSTVFNNPQCNGYVVADPTGRVHMYPHPAVRMTQWAFGARYDNDVVREWVIQQDQLWK